jgi:IclR family acetate operon transcriptional repressor
MLCTVSALMTGKDGRAKPQVQSVVRALTILRHVATSREGLTTREISEATGLNRQTAYHLVNTLISEGFLTPGRGRRHRLGMGVGTLVEQFRRQLDPPEQLMPHVRSISAETGETAFLAGWREGEIVVLGSTSGDHPVSVTPVSLGTFGSAHARASGKVLLAFAAPEAREEYLRRRPSVRFTPNTLVEQAELDRAFDRVRAEGYAVDREEFVIGVSCIAAPLDAGASPYALAMSAPTDRFVARFDEYRRIVLEAASAASSPALAATNEG